MSITPEVNAKTLTQLVATEIKVQMARADVRQSQLARELGKNEQWLSVRLRGRQPIDVNDLYLIAKALGVGIHDLLPPPDVAARATVRPVIGDYLPLPVRPSEQALPAQRNRPPGRADSTHPAGSRRTARVARHGRPNGG